MQASTYPLSSSLNSSIKDGIKRGRNCIIRAFNAETNSPRQSKALAELLGCAPEDDIRSMKTFAVLAMFSAWSFDNKMSSGFNVCKAVCLLMGISIESILTMLTRVFVIDRSLIIYKSRVDN